jgi:hypothetical protein
MTILVAKIHVALVMVECTMNTDYCWNDIDKENPKFLEKSLSSHFVRHKSVIGSPGIEPGTTG